LVVGRARAAAEQATQAKSAFLASMSHEIRTPMTGVLGMADLLATEDLTTRQRRYVDVMRASGRHLLAVTNDILDYSRIEAGRLEVEQIDFSLPELLECMRSLLQPLALERDIELRFELPPAALPLLTGDPTRLQQVLLNLASNAIKFTPQGRVTVRLLAQPRGARAVLLRLEVQDTGLGIPREALEQLFTPFTQADASIARQYGGSGLGLAISKRLAEAMGGTLDAASTPGLGSVFTLELALPVASSQAGAGQTAAAVAAVAPLRILVAEDNGINRDILQAALAARGHQLQFACDGNEALDLVQRHPFDLVLMDVQMPGLDGVEATRRIRQLDSPVRGIPVIALTANVLASEQERFLRAGMNECLAKPIDWERLFAAIGRYGDASAPVPAAAPTGLPDEGGACAEIDEQRLTVLQDITQPEHLRQLLASAVNTALAAHRRMQTSDLLAVVAEAHNLRGSCGTLGLALIAQTAGRIENAARAGQRDTELLARLGVQVEATRRSLAGRALL
jgi:CheY-like chemotaxis protein